MKTVKTIALIASSLIAFNASASVGSVLARGGAAIVGGVAGKAMASTSQAERYADSFADQMRPNLHQMETSDMRAISVFSQGDTVTLLSELKYSKAQHQVGASQAGISIAQDKRNTVEKTLNYMCHSEMKPYVDAGLQVKYTYNYNDGHFSHEILVNSANCRGRW